MQAGVGYHVGKLGRDPARVELVADAADHLTLRCGELGAPPARSAPMLNYIWAGLIIISLVFALWTDVGDLSRDTYRNGTPLPVALDLAAPFDGAADDDSARRLHLRFGRVAPGLMSLCQGQVAGGAVGGDSETGDAGHVLGAGAQAPLLPSPVQGADDRRPVPGDQRADALRAADFRTTGPTVTPSTARTLRHVAVLLAGRG